MSDPKTDSQIESQQAVAKEVYLYFKEHRTSANWLLNEPTWCHLSKKEQTWWIEFIALILKKVRLESLSLKAQ